MTKSCLYITNGDGAGDLLKESAIKGDVLPWRDTMHEGPFPGSLDLDKVSEIRAQYFAGPDLVEQQVREDFAARNRQLKTAPQYDQVILWFEHDLLDQLQILQILDWFGATEFDLAKLSLICTDSFAGIENFRGLGQLNPEQIASLIDVAEPVTQDQIQIATAGWQAFRSPDPRDLLKFMTGNLNALPFLKTALQRHLQEYPWQKDGLTRTERQLLTLVANDVCKPGALFVENMNLETRLFMGDWTTFAHVVNLNTARVPLLTTESGQPFVHPRDTAISTDDFSAQRLALTDAGDKVLKGVIMASDAMERDFYLGGVHIKSGQPMWMWNDDTQTLFETNETHN